MNLTFLGRGSAFNPKEGNNAAYFIDKDELFLIDCGELVFAKLLKTTILNQVKQINIMITHTHADHIGSIGSLVTYAYFNLNKKVNIILPDNALHKDDIITILRIFGCPSNTYNLINEKDFDNKYNSFKEIRFIKTKHTNIIPAYSLIFNTNNGIIYYSGDSEESKIITDLINSKRKIDKLYVDVTNLDLSDNVHLYIGTLKEIIPDYLKDKTYCMHLNSSTLITEAKAIGFNVVEVPPTLKRQKK